MTENEGTPGTGVAVQVPTGIIAPTAIVGKAQEVANALVDVVKDADLVVRIGKSDHMRIEGWQSLGAMASMLYHGSPITVRTLSTEFITIAGVKGFKAVAGVFAGDQQLGQADAICMQDEENWSNKPLFQLESMAQTRAGSKGLASVLRWIVVLAGTRYSKERGANLSGTPAEEMTGKEDNRSSSGLSPEYKKEYSPNKYKGHCFVCHKPVEIGEGRSFSLHKPDTYKDDDGKEHSVNYRYFHHDCYAKATTPSPSEPELGNADSPISPEDIEQIQALFEKRGIKVQGQTKWLKEAFGVEVVSQLSVAQAAKAIKSLSQAK